MLLFHSRTLVLYRNGVGSEATEDLEVTNPAELHRVLDAGGRVVDGRLLGPRGFSVTATRSLGWFQMRVRSFTPKHGPLFIAYHAYKSNCRH